MSDPLRNHCCVLDCPNEGLLMIITGNSPDDVTVSCQKFECIKALAEGYEEAIVLPWEPNMPAAVEAIAKVEWSGSGSRVVGAHSFV